MTVQQENSNEGYRRIDPIDSLFSRSDLSVEHTAKRVKVDDNDIRKIIDDLVKKDAREDTYEQSNIQVGQIMKRGVVTLDCSKTALDAASMMIEKGVGCVVVTMQGKPFGMVTERDILCEMIFSGRMLADVSLEVIASRPLVYVSPVETIENVVDLMMRNSIRRVLVVENDNLVGLVAVKDLAMLLSSTKRPDLAKAVLQAASRSRNI